MGVWSVRCVILVSQALRNSPLDLLSPLTLESPGRVANPAVTPQPGENCLEPGPDVRVQVLATDKPAGDEIDFKYALIGTVLGLDISEGFLALKICLIWKHLSDQDSVDQRNTARSVPGEGPGILPHSVLLRWSVPVRFLTL
ncbi:putative uncharacterized protein C10orf128 homolog [Heterocephalus glaber]|uniref:Uncharacterized protein n=1 Tax=Heterocephalus glaber TaxID=10181 RepID=A0AAX6SGH2_HETGA|nr:putative uncharacterized protein C10orf128 homolog [Heterocephalus glaber]